MEVKNWAKNIDWNRRIKAVCKPCWEIKYCPYGSLVDYICHKKKIIKKRYVESLDTFVLYSK